MTEKKSFGEEAAIVANAHVDSWVRFARAVYPALLIGTAVFAFLTQPMVRFLDVYSIYAGAFLFVMALVTLSASITFQRNGLAIAFGFAALMGSWYYIGGGMDAAAKKAGINDVRCEIIEREMLSAHPRRTDLPDIFNALGCHPQTRLNIQLPQAPNPKVK